MVEVVAVEEAQALGDLVRDRDANERIGRQERLLAFLREALDSLPPDLALYDTPLGPLRGKACGLERGQLADEGPNAKRFSMVEYAKAVAKVRGSSFPFA